MDLVRLFELVKMGFIVVGLIFSVATVCVAIRDREFSDDLVTPWELEERRQAKKEAKAKKKEARRQAKYWRKLEKTYR